MIGAAALTIIKICLVPLGSHLFPSPRLRHGFVSLGLLCSIASFPLTRGGAERRRGAVGGPPALLLFPLGLEFARSTLSRLFEISDRALRRLPSDRRDANASRHTARRLVTSLSSNSLLSRPRYNMCVTDQMYSNCHGRRLRVLSHTAHCLRAGEGGAVISSSTRHPFITFVPFVRTVIIEHTTRIKILHSDLSRLAFTGV